MDPKMRTEARPNFKKIWAPFKMTPDMNSPLIWDFS